MTLDELRDRYAVDIESCWIAKPSVLRDKGTKGRVKIGGRMTFLHRAAWEMLHGITLGKRVLVTSCYEPGCFNPKHYALCTREMAPSIHARRGRLKRDAAYAASAAAAKRARSKLDMAKVREIRARVAAGESQSAVAREIGMSASHVHLIVHHAAWRENRWHLGA